MTNPDNIVRVRARNGGRASVYEANGWAQAYTSGFLEGNGVIQNTSADMNVLVGGSSTKPDVVLAQNAAGYRIALDLVGQQAVAVTAPASNSRISAIVAYTDDLSLSTTEDTVTGSPASCGLIVVNGTSAANPSEPTDTQIRNAITSDGATGSQAAYCVIATILVASGTTTITDSLITINKAGLAGTGVVRSDNIDFTTFEYPSSGEAIVGKWYNGKPIYRQHFAGSFTATSAGTNNVLIDGNIQSVISALGQYSPNSTPSDDDYYRKWIGCNDYTDAYIRVDVTATNKLRFACKSSQYEGQTGSYDIVVDYTKIND